MAYTTQKTVTARMVDGVKVQAGRIDPSVQTLPQMEGWERETLRYEPPLIVRAPNTDDQVDPGYFIELWSE